MSRSKQIKQKKAQIEGATIFIVVAMATAVNNEVIVV